MSRLRTTILGTMVAAASILSPPKAFSTGNCPSANVDFEIVVHFSGISGDSLNCPLSVEPVAVVGTNAKPCTSGKPNCITKENNGGNPTKVRWRSDPAGMNYSVVFSPFRGPQIRTTHGSDGCATGDISTTANDNVPPLIEGTVVMYKYTIVSAAAPGGGNEDPAGDPVEGCPPLDPDVWVER